MKTDNLFFILFFLVMSFFSPNKVWSQYISFDELSLLLKKNQSEINEYLLKKKWEFNGTEKSDHNNTTTTWSFNKNYSENNKAQSWLSYYVINVSTNFMFHYMKEEKVFISYTFTNNEYFQKYVNSINAFKMKKIYEHVDLNKITNDYAGNSLVIRIQCNSSTADQASSFIIEIFTKETYLYTIDKLLSDEVYSILKNIKSDEFIDKRDNRKYKTIKISNQTWFAENLNYKADNGSWCFDNNQLNCDKYGRLYNWQTAKKSCPNGWHLPSDFEWKILEVNLGLAPNETNYSGERGSIDNVGTKLKTPYYWDDNSTNESGFSALPCGYRTKDGLFSLIPYKYCNWWTSTEYEVENKGAWYRGITGSYIKRYQEKKELGYSVRCIKD